MTPCDRTGRPTVRNTDPKVGGHYDLVRVDTLVFFRLMSKYHVPSIKIAVGGLEAVAWSLEVDGGLLE